MPFDFDTPKTFFEKGAKAVDWVAEEIIRQKNWRSLLVLIDVALFLAFNPFEWPFANLLSLFPQLRQFGWYAPAFWSLTCVIFAIAVIVAARAKRKTAEHAELKLGAIKGLLPFGYEDAGVFSHLQRDQNLKECLQAIGDEQWRFGVLSGDFFDRLNELQKAMRYSLSPTQSFRLERFEPDQATEVFCFLAEKEGLEYDRKFISEMTRQELADAEDGLISPVDIQALARMIERQTTQGARAFDRATFQKLGGVEGLLERYMTTALEPLVTQSRRQAAIKVLLALTDLERNARAGALTFEDLRRKLDDIADSELKDAVAYLLLGDVRLISPSSENEEEKFELAHERLIPALRRLAGKQLSLADRADQLLDRRTNEWLGNERDSRYLFSWSELRLINKHRRFLTWGKQRQAKGELLAASRRRLRLRYAALGLAPLLAFFGWIGWNSNAWQTYLIKRELRNYGARLNDSTALNDIAKAFAYAGDSQFTLQVVDRISHDGPRVRALREVADSYASLGDKEKAGALLSKDLVLDAILSSKFATADVGRLRSLISRYADEKEKVGALARISDSVFAPRIDWEVNWSDATREASGQFRT